MLISLWTQMVALAAFGALQGYGVIHGVAHLGPILAVTLLASGKSVPIRLRSASVALGMFTAAAVAVHTSGGAIEAHFYFFVVIVTLSLYEDWLPFLLAIGFVVVHHGLLGMIDPSGVYAPGSPGAGNPWGVALIHGGFVTAAGVASVLGWRLNEDVRVAAHRSQEQFQRSFEDAPIGMALTSADGRWVEVNRGLCDLIGYRADELVDHRFVDFAHPEDAIASLASLRRLNDGEDQLSFDMRYLHSDGSTVWASVHISKLTDPGEMDAHFIVQMEDVTARKKAERDAAIRASQQEDLLALARTALSAPELPGLFDEAVQVLARNIDDVVGIRVVESGRLTQTQARVVAELGSDPLPDGEPVLTPPETKALATADHVSEAGGTVAVIADNDDQPYGTLAVSTPGVELKSEDAGLVLAVSYVLSGAVQRMRSEEELRHQSLHDPLVDLPNRVLFFDRVERALSRSRRGEQCAVIFIDLDRFKIINDSLGHEAGDALLQAVAPRLARALRENDTLARFGGDEFVVLCEDLDDATNALDVAQRLRDAFDAPYHLGEHHHVISASIGVAVSGPKYLGHPEELLRDADAAMYRAKATGGNRIELFDEVLRARVVQRLEIEGGLRQAVAHDELILHYQPIVDLATERVVHCEALVRWEHPQRGLIPPNEFIPVAEETGLILAVGDWVLEEACRQMAEWSDGPMPELASMPVSVNLSALQVVQDDLVASITAMLDRYGLSPERLICEITETALIKNPDAADQTLLALEELGVRVALDDFGTGYSSLASLKRFALSAIKLDRSFISEMTPGSRDAAIIGSLVKMAGSLGLGVVAEGVETNGQSRQLSSMGCEIAQGYLFGRAVAPAEFAQQFIKLRHTS